MDNIEQERKAISELKQGNIDGLEVLVRLHQLSALRSANALIGQRQLAEDCVSDAFLDVVDHIQQFDARRPFAPWLYRIVINNVLTAIRKQARSRRLEQRAAVRRPCSSEGNPEEEASKKEMRSELIQAIMRLPERQRAATVLRYYLDMDERSIAKSLGCPIGTVKWRLHAAKRRLQRDIEFSNDPHLAFADSKGEAT